jgi:hypothetical protein
LDQKYFVATLALSRAFWSETCISNRRMLRAECLLRAAKGKHLTKYLESVITGTLLGLLPALICSGCIAPAQAQDQFARASSNDGPSNSPGANAAAGATATSQSSTETNATESSIFYSLLMAGKTQDQFTPLTPKERLKVYAKDLFAPFHFLMAGASAGITQVQNVPPEWGQGTEGYARRFANYYAYATTSSMLQMAGEDLLHEDNLYYGSGEHGAWRRVKYAVERSVLARSDDGSSHFSISQVGSTAGAAFISRLWQPRSNDSAGDGAVSFGISMATNAGVNVIREFLPDITRHVFHHGTDGQ